MKREREGEQRNYQYLREDEQGGQRWAHEVGGVWIRYRAKRKQRARAPASKLNNYKVSSVGMYRVTVVHSARRELQFIHAAARARRNLFHRRSLLPWWLSSLKFL